MNRLTEAPRSVYIHIPFCANKCHYCDFNSYVVTGQPVNRYLDALEREMEMTVTRTPPQTIDTIFVGGGTPTILRPAQLEKFLKAVRTYFPADPARVEFTMEANPGTVDAEKLAAMKEGGVNRISFGVQSFDDQLLADIGRIHQAADVFRSIESAKQAGFTNLSIDLMFGLPRQTIATLNDSIDKALALQLEHYSIYGLILEEHTLFYTLYQNGKLPLPDEDTEVQMFELIISRMREAGYTHYEISNFALPGCESRHNSAYWKNESYYGLGAGAHGYVRGIRHLNVKGVGEYITATEKGLPVLKRSFVDEQEAMEDFMMIGLRLLRGIRRDDFFDQFGRLPEDVFGAKIAALIARGLLDETDEGYKLSATGLYLGNEVFAEFIS
ncbi:MAG TPA: radical SAM family heme chaperone HemW [Bacilli bacterium]